MELKVEFDRLRERKLFLATPCYGGQCAGMFARACMGLSVECTKANIPLNVYFLFNESLITRARNYAVDEFLRSDCQSMLFIDSDIGFDPRDVLNMLAMQAFDDEKYGVIGAPYPKKSCSYDTEIMTEDGPKKIGVLVNKKYSGKVLSQNDDGNFEWQPVINWFKTKNISKPFLKLTYHGGSSSNSEKFRSKLKCTPDHEFRVVDNLLDPSFRWMEAKDLLNKFVVTKPKKNLNCLYTKEQVSFLIGTLLGDGTISPKGRAAFGHGEKQKAYAELKSKMFGGHVKMTKNRGYKKNNSYRFEVPINPQTKLLRELMYENGKKTVRNVIHLVDEKALAFWYMDDGCVKNNDDSGSTPYVQLSTDGFIRSDCWLIADHLKRRWGLEVSVLPKVDNESEHLNDMGSRVFVRCGSSEKFFRLVAPYVIPCLEYKVPSSYRAKERYSFPTEPLPYTIKTVLSIDSIEPEDQYDVTVEKNGNFVLSSGLLAHNCISWEKIKAAVDRGLADSDPNSLEKYVGDYVFNPKNGQSHIPIAEPVEVLEAGTGFMMISRKALEAFSKKFPEYMYKPDHVRTEHFDGSREIMQFFQAEIDPKSKRYLSEDYWFCQKAQEAGVRVWLCPWVQTKHVGSYVFAGSLADLAAAGVSATADPDSLGGKKKSTPQKPIAIPFRTSDLRESKE